MKKSIIWLASYPKSGNTWARIFLANYLMNADKPVPINEVHRFGMGDSIARTYHMVAGRTIDLSDMQLTLSLRNKVLRGIVANNADVNFVKTHNTRMPVFGHNLIPAEYTRSAVYILRNPYDVVLSYARHYGMTHEETVDAMRRADNANAFDGSTVWQFLGSWTQHVQSWEAKAPYPFLLLRYEDLLAEPQENFSKLLKHIGIPVEEERLERAIRFSSFNELTKQEAKSGFKERSPKNDRFFSKGTSGQWKTDLSPELVEQVRRDHSTVMRRHGYLDD